MPGIFMDSKNEDGAVNGVSPTLKENSSVNKLTKSTLSPHSPRSEAINPPEEACVDTSIERLYDNVCEMQSSADGSPSRPSFGSEGDESRIDSELCHLVGGDMRVLEIMEEESEKEEPVEKNATSKEENGSPSATSEKTHSSGHKSVSSGHSRKPSQLQLDAEPSVKSGIKSKGSNIKPPTEVKTEKNVRKLSFSAASNKKEKNFTLGASKLHNGTVDPAEVALDNPELGPFLLKHARDLISSGDNPQKALNFALRAAKSFEICADGKPSLELVLCLHVVAAIYCSLGQYSQAIPYLEHSIEIPNLQEGQEHALAKFAGHMQLGDTHAMIGQLENSIQCYKMGLEIQKQVLGEKDPRVGETCRYVAEAHVQALRFDEAQNLCQTALDIHKDNGTPASLEEAADRRLMGLICDTKGDHEAALEHLVLTSMAMVSHGKEAEVASVDCSIGDTYLALARYDEAEFAYQKALTAFKSTKGENHPTVASIFVRLADLYNKTGKIRESKSYCENALCIYSKPSPGIPGEEIGSGLTDVSAIYESMNEPEQALKLLEKALKIYNNAPGQQSTIAGIEAQMGVVYYMIGKYSDSYLSFKNAIEKLRTSGKKKSAFFGIALNQMGLVCVQRYSINEAADLFEEARSILEQEYGPYHPETLGIYSNLAGTYDAMGRLDDAIEILEYVVGIREEKLGTANPEVDDEKRRLAELLKEAGRASSRKAKSLETLLDTTSTNTNLIGEQAAIKV
ncbi:protein KINESIN LIGHT CHAIN-RELATED 3-like [Aristolochia californica]|uniref:protein KINESIN LIGHT CHAIN-RELATED 3-like n=1 Tax=Aristolochia californica TaxID=171875 RepID=UPI0035DF444B